MKKVYEAPEAALVEFEFTDRIAASATCVIPLEGYLGVPGFDQPGGCAN